MLECDPTTQWSMFLIGMIAGIALGILFMGWLLDD